MTYMLTFDDGSSAYLEHHGIKGMKWGVWNEETRAKRLGRGEALKQNKLSSIAENRRHNEIELANTKKAINAIQKNGRKELEGKGYSKSTADKAVWMKTEQLQRYAHMGEQTMKNNALLEKRIQDIDTSSTSYRKVKKQIKQASMEIEEANRTAYQRYLEEESLAGNGVYVRYPR